MNKLARDYIESLNDFSPIDEDVEPIVTRIAHTGAYQVSTILDGYWVTRTYYGYSKQESINLFKVELLPCNQ